MKKRFFGALGILGAVLAACELGARLALPSVPSCHDVSRNPFRFRGWPEYISGGRRDGDARTLVLLTNSQGYAGEFDHHKIYPARLETMLNAEGRGERPAWKVLNWSTDGMTSIELTLLAAYLRSHAPTLLLAVTGYADYAAEHAREGLLYCRSDVPRLGSRWAVARTVPFSYWRRHGKWEDTLTVWLHDRSALLRYREYVWSWLEVRFPGLHAALYAPRVNYLPWTLRARPLAKPLRRLKSAPGDPVLTYHEGSRQMLEDYLAVLAGVPSRLVVVSEPIALQPGDPRAAWQQTFQEDLLAATGARGLRCWDLADALPAEGFMTSSHFRDENHVRFAELLRDRLRKEFPDAL